MHDEIDRDAVEEVHRLQNLAALNALVERGQWTQREADHIHAAFMRSDALQTLITHDVQRLEAFLAGQVH
ncbi:hypothetical protein [Methylibium sp. Root1272]|uniref:hypothetical protein n=1 Tax=Methylibium sp. Root1272 TaxID=1736441 RepID=UPI0006FC7BD9|nr:hypothetical protein [Methylibium sp. Root1272]KQW70098.1 hypothetical protein ASC67_06370 [Methylibium sp. Root1272]